MKLFFFVAILIVPCMNSSAAEPRKPLCAPLSQRESVCTNGKVITHRTPAGQTDIIKDPRKQSAVAEFIHKFHSAKGEKGVIFQNNPDDRTGFVVRSLNLDGRTLSEGSLGAGFHFNF